MTAADHPQSRLLIPTLILLTTVTGVVSSLGAPLVPTIAVELGVSLGAAQWTLTASMLAGAVATPLMGRFAVGARRRPVVLGGLLLVVAGTVLAAMAPALADISDDLALGLLIAGRVGQGMALGLAPLAMAVAREILSPERIGPVMAALSVGTIVGAGLGYPLTAVVAQLGGVAAAFWFGTVLTTATLVLTWRELPCAAPVPAPRVRTSEALLLAVATSALLLGISQTTTWGWTDGRTLGLFVLGGLASALWLRLTLCHPDPLVDLRLAFGGAAAAPNITALLAGAGMYMGLTLLMVLVQVQTPAGWGLGQPVAIAGLMLVPYSVMSVLGSRISLWVGRRVDPSRVLPVGCAIYLLSTVQLMFAHDHVWQALLSMALAGLGSGSTFATLPVLLVRAVPTAETSSALAFNQVLRYIGFSVGSAVGITVLSLVSGPVPNEHGFVAAMAVNAGLWLLAILVVLGAVSGRRPGRRVTG
ncbi:MAG: MFS transporter [Mycobacterium sp.]